MGYYGRLDLKLKAQNMRSQGKSYLEIVNKLKLSKSTVSDWCKDIPLSNEHRRRLYENKRTGAMRGSIIAAENKKKERLQVTQSLYQEGVSDIGKLNKRERFIAGIAFYASEGTKIDKGCCFSNSNPEIIRFMVLWFREFGKVEDTRFHGAVWLHEGLNEQSAKLYWSSITGIPVNQFYKTYMSRTKIKSKKIRKNIHQYGIFSFYVNDVILIRRIMGWIGGVVKKPWYNSHVH